MRPLASTPSRTEQVHAAIRESICDCTLKPGTHLVQEDLAAQLGVSRQPVQQAMLLLKSEGLVVEQGGRGLCVAPISPESIVQHYQIREVLDCLAARLIAGRTRTDPACAEELRRRAEPILAEGEAAAHRAGPAEMVRQDVAFHSFLYTMSGNPMIASTAQPHWAFLRRVMIGILLTSDRGPLVWQQHRDILNALAEGAGDLAERLAREHVTGAQQGLIGALRAGRGRDLFGDMDLRAFDGI